jgi:hydroxymethylpyrimidine pyrophosphatase-like HAD family hydrolase
MSKRLAFIDLDGTLLGPDKPVSAANRAALGRLRAANVQIVIASGRHHRNIAALAGIGEPGWILSSQGAVVRNEQTGATLLELTMQSDRIKGICERARAGGMTVIAYHRDRAHIERTSPWTDFYARQTGWLPQQSDFRELAPDGFQKIIPGSRPSRRARAPDCRAVRRAASGGSSPSFVGPRTARARAAHRCPPPRAQVPS